MRALPTSTKAIPTAGAGRVDGRVERAELFWRISVPISALVLTLLAVPLAYVNPRMGRSFNLVAAAFLYMLYSNCLNIVQSLIAQGRLELWAGLLLPHAIALLVVVVLFRHQLSVTGLFARTPAIRCGAGLMADASPDPARRDAARAGDEDAAALHRSRRAVRDAADLRARCSRCSRSST